MTTPDRLSAALADRYRIERELGQGGMATVYLADDLRHVRKVAVKVLRPELAAVIGAERFLAEIRTTANLQHPHILPLFDSGEADGFLYYVMPFVEGESLRDRLSREKQLPIADAVRIATEVASALDYAHRHGVIHRDIKPENILVHDGRALVADFGIALAASKAGTRMTETGMSLGTPHYMSPEQAMGERVITARSDVYALGCVTYEMLVGDPPFTGSTAQAIVAKVMTEKPGAPSRLRDTIPPAVEDAVLTALEKLPADRFATAAEFAAALGGLPTVRATTRASQRAVAGSGPWRRISMVLATLLLGALALAAWALGRERPAAGPAVFDAALPEDAAITFGATTASTSFGTPLRNLSVSSDGSFAVYAARQGDSTMLWRRSLRDASARMIDGTRGGIAPRISPDGSRVAFLVGGRAMVVPVEGGEAELLLDGADPRMLEWVSPTSVLLIDFEGNRLSWLDPEGSQRPRTSPTRASLGFGHWIPEDRQLISSRNGTALIFDPETRESWPVRSTLPDGSPGSVLAGSAFRIVQGAFLVYIADGDLRAAAYDRTRHLAGRPVTLVSGIRRESVGAAQFDLTADGALVYAPGADAAVGRIVRLRPGSAPEPLPLDSAEFQRFDLSRDRRWLAVVVVTAGGQEVRIHDLRDGQRINWLRAEHIRHALWSPDGERLIVGLRDSTRWSILSGIPSTGMAPDTLYSSGLDGAFDPVDYRASDAVVAMNWATFAAVLFDPGADQVRFDTMATNARFATLSPDRTRMMYTEEGGRLVVASYPRGGRRWQVTADGAEPLWMSGTEILFRRGVTWYLARLDPATGEPLGAPTLWGRDPRFSDTAGWSNRPSHDGGIIYLQGPAQVSSSYLRVIPDWVAQMKSAVGAVSR
ncbi:MAG TPA: protein kinase [Gemmatimonadales bacterium]|nr:protein kinase [Gemmatimonadales bacterium]